MRLPVDDVALVVQNVVEFERALADVEVAPLDLDLRLGDRPGDHARLDRRRVVEAEARHETGHALGRKDANEVVLQRAEDPRGPRIPLAARAAATLRLDTPGSARPRAVEVDTDKVGDV